MHQAVILCDPGVCHQGTIRHLLWFCEQTKIPPCLQGWVVLARQGHMGGGTCHQSWGTAIKAESSFHGSCHQLLQKNHASTSVEFVLADWHCRDVGMESAEISGEIQLIQSEILLLDKRNKAQSYFMRNKTLKQVADNIRWQPHCHMIVLEIVLFSGESPFTP